MCFEAEMLVPASGRDDLGQLATATITSLVYILELTFEPSVQGVAGNRLHIVREELRPINKTDASSHLLFTNKPDWRSSVVSGKGGRTVPFISMERDNQEGRVQLHQDGGSRGRSRKFAAADLPRTVISTATADESPTALLAKREMQSWRLLQLEPSALRMPDGYDAPQRIDSNGAHLAATLKRLAGSDSEKANQIYSQVASRVSELVEHIKLVTVDVNKQRELLSLKVVERNGTQHFAKSLSDGTLRFLALAIMELDPEAQGLICFEEPENGIHPERIEPMIRLLTDLAVDSEEPIGIDNPLRQVIVNTHSPSVVSKIRDQDLLLARRRQILIDGNRCDSIEFCALESTWRSNNQRASIIAKGELLPYLNPTMSETNRENFTLNEFSNSTEKRRVIDRSDLQTLLPFMNSVQQ
jgi:hypothetical protein